MPRTNDLARRAAASQKASERYKAKRSGKLLPRKATRAEVKAALREQAEAAYRAEAAPGSPEPPRPWFEFELPEQRLAAVLAKIGR